MYNHLSRYLFLWINRALESLRVYPLTLSLGSFAICLIHFAHFKLITCDAQKQDPTLPHVYSTRRLFAKIFDTEVAIRMQNRPHSRSLNLASFPISHIGNRRFVDPRSRAGGEGEDRLISHPSLFLEIEIISIEVDRIHPNCPSIRTMGTVLRRRFVTD